MRTNPPTNEYKKMLIRCKNKRASALNTYELMDPPSYTEIARRYICSVTYAREIYKAKIERGQIDRIY